jgi:hypothetical protein
MTNTIFYSIPAVFFPGYKVIHPFHAKVKYEYNTGTVKIVEVGFSELCLERINNRGLIDRMKKDIADAERKKLINPIHPIVQGALMPFINS